MDAFDRVQASLGKGNPLDPETVGEMYDFFIETHAIVRERDATAAPREEESTEGVAGRSRKHSEHEGGADSESSASTEQAAHDAREEAVEYVTDGKITVCIHIEKVKELFTTIKEVLKSPQERLQEWVETVKTNRALKEWAASGTAPPRGWIQDGWDGLLPSTVKNQYALVLVLRGAICELITYTSIPASQKEDIADILAAIRLYKHADVHLEEIADNLEPLISVGFTHIREERKATITPSAGGSQTVKLARARPLPELTNTMNNSTVESVLDSWLIYPDGDLSQHAIAKAVKNISKKTHETESL